MKKESIASVQLEKLAKRAELYSVTFAFCRDPSKPEDNVQASGVLFKLKGHYFILTAGHVARYVETHGDPYISVANFFHSFRPKVVQHQSKFSDIDDRGFIELASTDANLIESCNKVFASPERILSASAKTLKQEGSPLFLFGFPKYYAKELNRPFFLISKTLGNRRPVELPQADDDNYIDIQVDRSKMILFDGTRASHTLPGRLGGASGAGLWKVTSGDFPPEDIRLVGIATFHSQEHWTKGAPDIGFIRGIRIDKVLALIGDTYPELKTDIEKISSNKP
jgi:hypothetical protein